MSGPRRAPAAYRHSSKADQSSSSCNRPSAQRFALRPIGVDGQYGGGGAGGTRRVLPALGPWWKARAESSPIADAFQRGATGACSDHDTPGAIPVSPGKQGDPGEDDGHDEQHDGDTPGDRKRSILAWIRVHPRRLPPGSALPPREDMKQPEEEDADHRGNSNEDDEILGHRLSRRRVAWTRSV